MTTVANLSLMNIILNISAKVSAIWRRLLTCDEASAEQCAARLSVPPLSLIMSGHRKRRICGFADCCK